MGPHRLYASLWTLMLSPYSSLWTLVGPFESLLIVMGLYGSL